MWKNPKVSARSPIRHSMIRFIQPVKERLCVDCKVLLTDENSGLRKSETNPEKVYRKSICRKCEVRRAQKWQQGNHERYLQYARNYYFKKKNEQS